MGAFAFILTNISAYCLICFYGFLNVFERLEIWRHKPRGGEDSWQYSLAEWLSVTIIESARKYREGNKTKSIFFLELHVYMIIQAGGFLSKPQPNLNTTVGFYVKVTLQPPPPTHHHHTNS